MKKLFICNQAKNRSKTAAKLFKANYCGIYSQENPLTKEKLQKADIIYTMEETQRKYIAQNFPTQYLQKNNKPRNTRHLHI